MTKKPSYEELEQRFKALEAENEKKNRFLRESRDGVYHLDLQNNEIEFYNDFYNFLFRGTDGKITKKSIALTLAGSISPEEINAIKREVAVSLQPGKEGGEVYFKLKFPDGTFHWLHDRWKIVRDDRGNPIAIEGIVRDITELKKAEASLHDSRNMLQTVLNSIPAAVFWKDRDSIYLGGNRTWLAATGLNSSAEVVGKSDYDLPWSKKEADSFREDDRRVIESGIPEYDLIEPYRRANGTQAWAKTNKVPLRDTEGNIIGVLGTYEDITERKLAKKTLQKERDTAQRYLDLAGVIFVAINNKGEVTLINQKGCEVLGYNEEEIVGKNWFENFIPEWLKEDLIPVSKKLLNGDIKSAEYHENPILTKTGEERVIAWHNTILRDAEGNIIGHLSSGEDITEQKRAEKDKRKLEEQLIQAQRMESIGTLAEGIAHDFNNILSPIMIYTEIVMSSIPDESPLQSNLKKIFKASERARDLVQQILTFSRQTEKELKPLEVGSVFKETLKLLRSSLPTTIEIRQKIKTKSGIILADPTQIHQVLMNLCTNAFHAMRDKGGVLDVTLQDIHIDAEAVNQYPDLNSGPYLRLTVSDTGHGMAPEIMERIFDPYFTTKEKGEGTGLGLSVIHGIVRGYSGAINVKSEPGKGTTFYLLFPRIEKEVYSGEKTIISIPGGNERIFFVDDEKYMVDAVKPMLEGIGYQVTTRTSSLEALEAFRAQPEKFDLVITDMTMPYMTGAELARGIIKIRSDIPIILCTGFSELIDEKKAKEMGIRAFVMKPIVRREMAEIIREVLEEKYPFPDRD